MTDLAPPPTTGTRPAVPGVGQSAPRPDGVPKVTGQFAFSSDLSAEGMLWGATLRSPHPSARIAHLDIGAALAVPGVVAVLTADDVPGQASYGLEDADQPVLARDVVRYVGEPVALVAADHPDTARRALAEIVVGWEPLEALTDCALALDVAPVHPDGNLFRHVAIRHGDPDVAVADGDVVVEGTYEVGMQDQAFLGPESALAVPGDDGGVELYVSTQWLHVDHRQVAACLGLPDDAVRLTLAGVGGAFGAREDVSLQVHICLLALATGRPVKMVYGREESFHGHVHRHPARMWYRHHARPDGTLVNVECRLNPLQVVGQLEGGTAQGVGLALMEEIVVEGGRMRNASFTDYLIPTTLDLPDLHIAALIEEPEPGAPFGAKGVGEAPTISSTPAVAAAVRAATGLALPRVPIRPSDIALGDPTATDAPVAIPAPPGAP